MKAETEGGERGGSEEAKQNSGGKNTEPSRRKYNYSSSFSSSYKQMRTGHHFLGKDNCTHACSRYPHALDIIAYADCSSYENTALHANCLSKEMLWHDSWLELQREVIFEG